MHLLYVPGCDRECLLRTCTALVLSKMGNGYAVYTSASRLCLNKLNPVYRAGVLYATMAFHIVQHKGYIVKQKRRSYISDVLVMLLTYVAIILALRLHINNTIARTLNRSCTFNRHRVLELAHRYNVQVPMVQKHVTCPHPVSYTHLDVYKRQALYSSILFISFIIL